MLLSKTNKYTYPMIYFFALLGVVGIAAAKILFKLSSIALRKHASFFMLRPYCCWVPRSRYMESLPLLGVGIAENRSW